MPVSGKDSGAINIILFDLVNTPATDQLNARRQMLKVLEALPTGQRIALFVLSDRLRMIQGFTGSSDLLVSAAKMLDPKDFHLLRSQAEQFQDADELERLAAAIGRDPGQFVEHLIKDRARDDAINADWRARFTLTALGELARATSGYPGRKNLLWLSDSFPLSVGAQMEYNPDAQGDLAHSSADLQSLRETANLIAAAQIAVYPISLLGLQTDDIGPEARGRMDDSIAHQLGVDRSGQQLRYAMEDLARQTGGEAFFATNDIAGALRRSVEDGSSYYTLAYHPQNQKWNGRFRQMRVELAQKGDSLTYRRGYFATPNKASASPAQELNQALQPDTPESTVLVLRSKVLLPDAKHSALHIDSVLEPSGIGFTITPDGHRHAQLLVLLIALNDGEKQMAAPPQTSGTLGLDLTDTQFELALSSGIPIHQELALKPGQYRLRLGVSDITNHNLGTLDMPVKLAATQ